jgi:tRNA pseudouridine55 synthase
VAAIRTAMRLGKVGHGGTLDPFATGVLPLMVNSATRIATLLTGDDKVYEGVGRLGVTTDTMDPTGTVTDESPVDGIDEAAILGALAAFRGEIEQIPPMYSAAKVGGERLYKLARKNVEVERKPKQVTIHELELLSLDLPRFTFRVHCSSGTYVRALVDDAGRALGCGGHLESLVRTRSGNFRLEDAVELDPILQASDRFRDHGPALRPLPDALGLATVPLGPDALAELRSGRPIRAGALPEPPVFEAGQTLLAVLPDGRTAAIVRSQCRSDLVPRMPPGTPVLQIVRGLNP